MNNTLTSQMQKIPGIGDIPILGLLFKSKAAQKNQTELVVMITPQILPRNSPGVTPNLPRTPDTFMPPVAPNRTHEMPPAAFTRPSSSAAAADAPVYVTPTAEPANQKNATAAADTMRALTPSRPVAHVPEAPTPAAQPAAEAPKASAAPASQAAAKPAKSMKEDDRAREAAETDAQKRAEIDRKNARLEQERQAKAAKEQVRRDAEQAKRDAEQARKDAEAARIAAVEAKKQAELDRERQREIDEAAAKAKAAEAKYQELLKQKMQPQTRQ
jgi:Bacterial type II and III secretion system protein